MKLDERLSNIIQERFAFRPTKKEMNCQVNKAIAQIKAVFAQMLREPELRQECCDETGVLWADTDRVCDWLANRLEEK